MLTFMYMVLFLWELGRLLGDVWKILVTFVQYKYDRRMLTFELFKLGFLLCQSII